MREQIVLEYNGISTRHMRASTCSSNLLSGSILKLSSRLRQNIFFARKGCLTRPQSNGGRCLLVTQLRHLAKLTVKWHMTTTIVGIYNQSDAQRISRYVRIRELCKLLRKLVATHAVQTLLYDPVKYLRYIVALVKQTYAHIRHLWNLSEMSEAS